jgi:hypothetical protein
MNNYDGQTNMVRLANFYETSRAHSFVNVSEVVSSYGSSAPIVQPMIASKSMSVNDTHGYTNADHNVGYSQLPYARQYIVEWGLHLHFQHNILILIFIICYLMLVMTIAELMKSHQTYMHRPPYGIVAYTFPTTPPLYPLCCFKS